MMRAAFDEGWIDMYPREGKSGGAFCAGYYAKNISRVMTNFAGSASDVSTLAHELGHAFNNRMLRHKPLMMTDTPMPLAETASTFNETLLIAQLLKDRHAGGRADAAGFLPRSSRRRRWWISTPASCSSRRSSPRRPITRWTWTS